RRGAAHSAPPRPRRRRYGGGLSADLARRRRVQSRPFDAARLDGGDRPAVGGRYGAGTPNRRRRHGTRNYPLGTRPPQRAPPPADRRSQTATHLHRAARTGPPTHAAARLLRRFQPRTARGQARHAGRSAEGVAAAQPARDRAVSQVMSELDYTD